MNDSGTLSQNGSTSTLVTVAGITLYTNNTTVPQVVNLGINPTSGVGQMNIFANGNTSGRMGFFGSSGGSFSTVLNPGETIHAQHPAGNVTVFISVSNRPLFG